MRGDVLTRVFDENDQEVLPGSDTIGMIATGGPGPVGYCKDPEKTARTFRVTDGQRYAFPGDDAKLAPDGSPILLGRGSDCINTGGETDQPKHDTFAEDGERAPRGAVRGAHDRPT